MQPAKSKPGSRWLRAGPVLIFCSAFWIGSDLCAESFGDLSVEPGAIYTGETFHGYAEIRVVVENHSPTRTHVVTLVYPNRSWTSGNCISRLARTAKLEPGARELVSLFQPPLPAQGDNSIRVEVDGRSEGEVRAPNANSHGNFNYGRNNPPVVFVSRSLDFDAVNLMLQPEGAGPAGISNPAAQAAGAPRAYATGRRNLSAAWMPDWHLGRSGGHWLELDYASPQIADKVVVHSVGGRLTSGELTLLGDSGTNLLKVPIVASNNIPDPGHGWNVEFNLPATAEPVKTVRLDFGTMAASAIAIDGVQLSGPAGSQWGSSARASSENAAPPSAGPGRVGVENTECLRAESPVSDWSAKWLSYSPFDAVVLSPADWSALPPAAAGALGDYVRTGGNLLLFGTSELPPQWTAAEKKTLPGAVEFRVGFGGCFAIESETTSGMDPATIKRLRDVAREASLYWQSLPDARGANSALPVVETLKIPTRGIVIIMLAFIILIGPVNLIYLTRIRRRTWMLWTIPAISVATTLLVLLYSLLREGITPDTRLAGITVLDQAGHHAATIGAEGFYCPLTPSGGLHFDFDTEATPLVRRDYGSGSAREVDWSQGQHLARGWVSSRVPAHFHLRKPETRRERIQVVKENGVLLVVNSLGAPIKTLWYAGASTNVYEAHDIPAGAKAALAGLVHRAVTDKPGAGGLLRELTFSAGAETLGVGTEKYLLPNTYIAVLDGNPFLENALGSAASPLRTKAFSVVFGTMEPGTQ